MSFFGRRENKAAVRKPQRRVRLQLEALEDRLVPSTTTAPDTTTTSPPPSPPPPTTSYTVTAGDVNTLIADINAANTNGANTPTTINLSAGVYDFTAVNNNTFGPNALPVITGNVTINGNGAILERDPSLTASRFFYVSQGSSATNTPAGSLTLENLTLEGGLAQGGNSDTGGGGLGAGGAILNQGNLALNGVTLTQNIARGGSGGVGTAGGGGGIGQDAQGDNGGGAGVGGAGSSTGSGAAGGIGGGGGDSTAAATGTTTYSGGAGGWGGGGGSGASQGGAGGFGGGGGSGGASGSAGAGGFGAGAGNASEGGGGLGAGGAIFNQYGTTTLVNSTLAGNLAQGGQGASVGNGYGGAIFNLDGTVNVTSSTIASNSVMGASTGGGALYNLAQGTTTDSTGAAQGTPSTVTLTDSILANSVGGNDVVNDQNNSTAGAAVINATTPNLVTALVTQNGSTTNGTPSTGNPQLGVLLNYGGPTATMPLLSGSAALGIGTAAANVPTTDQRGVTRGNAIDLGAYQSSPPVTATTTLTLTANTSASLSTPTLTATITVSSGSTTPAGTVQFVDSTTGTVLGSAPVTVSNGQAQATLTPATALTSGGHTITATYTSSNDLGGSTASTTVTNNSSDQIWLNQVYKTLLGRPVDPSGLAYWSSILSGSSRSAVAYLIMQTTEYRTDEISGAFQKLLGRAVDPTSLGYYLGLMAQGTNFQTIESIIAGSTEYYNNIGGGTNGGFLNALYETFLNRPLDATGQSVWGTALASGQTTTQVALGIISSQEYMTDLVQQDYQTYLNRAADPTSLTAFVAGLTGGSMNNDLVVATLLGSGEYSAQLPTS